MSFALFLEDVESQFVLVSRLVGRTIWETVEGILRLMFLWKPFIIVVDIVLFNLYAVIAIKPARMFNSIRLQASSIFFRCLFPPFTGFFCLSSPGFALIYLFHIYTHVVSLSHCWHEYYILKNAFNCTKGLTFSTLIIF